MYIEKNPGFDMSTVHCMSSTVSSKVLCTIAQAEGANFTVSHHHGHGHQCLMAMVNDQY